MKWKVTRSEAGNGDVSKHLLSRTVGKEKEKEP